MEEVKVRSRSGIAKLASVALSIAGVLVIAFYTGVPSRVPPFHPPAFTLAMPYGSKGFSLQSWPSFHGPCG